MSTPITTLLVANRGEIACRIMRTAKALGIRTVAVHSEVDRLARHVREADMAINLGGAKPADSYLRTDLILAAAKATGAQAVHPGYGFLSENAEFARACENQGLIFIGPPASAIDAMGSKSAAKTLMAQAGVPLVPGYHGDDQSLTCLRQEITAMGYPVLLKAVAGGGGKGMKVVESDAELAAALASAQREALASFGDSRMLVERYLIRPRHIEIQVFADQHGHCIHLNERDCSIQRRHQKVIEEAPAPGLSAALREAMGDAAVTAAKAIGYVGAGTVEFLLDEQQRFYFMEMNTRLQVEHPVTEAITGQDLVAWQLNIAQGKPLPLEQAQVPLNGHAIEARLYAEDPCNGFLPASGGLALYREPAPGPGRRMDSGVSEGDDVSPFYDPMLAKLIAWGDTREAARLNLLGMLRETAIAGLQTNLSFLTGIIEHPAFAAAQLDTGFISRHETVLIPPRPILTDDFWAVAGCAWLISQRLIEHAPPCPWQTLPSGWRSGLPASSRVHLRSGEQGRQLDTLDTHGCSFDQSAQMLTIERDGMTQRYPLRLAAGAVCLFWQSHWHPLQAFDPISQAEQAQQHSGGLLAPMNGSIVRLMAQVGDRVQAGSVLLVLEAMKMEHSIRAPQDGKVTALFCVEGDLVAEGTVLVELEDSE
ncbi:acetyl/propionyl/methylcrotonyl-CoA carboxylase subunit alpha [Halopseudomonas pelagia]|uniref:acetyl/propionyl/methylcrotonyl-CoA carboxylase subunit alpha n=1 Tax=Halopseudomonas pelagia TaxID=553151 RepID=UPI0030DDA4DA|tara:strand:+ start:181798 stop:183750 length:1953 start_codon:yes stop_codon:yes gene_type:complete